jgi:hypothetical protein
VLHRLETAARVAPQLSDGLHAQLGELALLGIAEQVLHWVQLGCKGRQTLELDRQPGGLYPEIHL